MTTEQNKIKFGLKELEQILGPTTIGSLLSGYRFSFSMTQTQLAKKLGISRANLCDLEKGRKIPSPGRAFQIAKKLKEHPQFWVQIAIQDDLRSYKLNYTVKIEPNSKVA